MGARRVVKAACTSLFALVAGAGSAFGGLAAPSLAAPSQNGPRIVDKEQVADNWWKITVYSPSMDKEIVNDVLRAPAKSAPTFYLLQGAEGGQGGRSWFDLTNAPDFFKGKRVNVIAPIGDPGSMYTDWDQDDPVLGRVKWQTYLTKELPAALGKELGMNGKTAVGGVSISAGPAIDLMVQDPKFFSAAAAYSGCPITSGARQWQTGSLVRYTGGGDAANMWSGDEWAAHDPSQNLAKLKGKPLYLAASTGAPRGRPALVGRRGAGRLVHRVDVAAVHGRVRAGRARRGAEPDVRPARGGRPRLGPVRLGDGSLLGPGHRPRARDEMTASR